jgi:hypothetical protein
LQPQIATVQWVLHIFGEFMRIVLLSLLAVFRLFAPGIGQSVKQAQQNAPGLVPQKIASEKKAQAPKIQDGAAKAERDKFAACLDKVVNALDAASAIAKLMANAGSIGAGLNIEKDWQQQLIANYKYDLSTGKDRSPEQFLKTIQARKNDRQLMNQRSLASDEAQQVEGELFFLDIYFDELEKHGFECLGIAKRQGKIYEVMGAALDKVIKKAGGFHAGFFWGLIGEYLAQKNTAYTPAELFKTLLTRNAQLENENQEWHDHWPADYWPAEVTKGRLWFTSTLLEELKAVGLN